MVDFLGVVGGYGLWQLIYGYGWQRILFLCVCVYIFVKVFLDYFNVLNILF